MKADTPSTALEKYFGDVPEEKTSLLTPEEMVSLMEKLASPKVLAEINRLNDIFIKSMVSLGESDMSEHDEERLDALLDEVTDVSMNVMVLTTDIWNTYGKKSTKKYNDMMSKILPGLVDALVKKRFKKFNPEEHFVDELKGYVTYMEEFSRFAKAGDALNALKFFTMAMDEYKHALYIAETDLGSRHHTVESIPAYFREKHGVAADAAISVLPKTMKADSPVYKEYRDGKRTVAFDQVGAKVPPGSKYKVSRWKTSGRGNTYRITSVIPPDGPVYTAVFEVDVTDAVGKSKPEKEVVLEVVDIEKE